MQIIEVAIRTLNDLGVLTVFVILDNQSTVSIYRHKTLLLFTSIISVSCTSSIYRDAAAKKRANASGVGKSNYYEDIYIPPYNTTH